MLPSSAVIANVEQSVYKPITNIASNASCLEFLVEGNLSYVDLSRTTLYLQVRIVRGDGSKLKDTENCALSNHAMAAMFNQIDVQIADQTVSRLGAPLVAFKNVLDSVLVNSNDSSESFMACTGFYREPPGTLHVTKTQPDDTGNGSKAGTNLSFNI